MEWGDLESFVMVILGICAMIAALSGACAAVVKFWRYAHKQSEENAATLNQVETYLASDKRRIEALEKKNDIIDEQQKLQLEALVMLLGHEIDGNHTKNLIDVRDKIQQYLIRK